MKANSYIKCGFIFRGKGQCFVTYLYTLCSSLKRFTILKQRKHLPHAKKYTCQERLKQEKRFAHSETSGLLEPMVRCARNVSCIGLSSNAYF